MDNKGDLNLKNNLGNTPMLNITQNKSVNEEILQLMIEKKGDFNCKNKLGISLLDNIIKFEKNNPHKESMVLLLLLRGLNVDKDDLKDQDISYNLHQIIDNHKNGTLWNPETHSYLSKEMKQITESFLFSVSAFSKKYSYYFPKSVFFFIIQNFVDFNIKHNEIIMESKL